MSAIAHAFPILLMGGLAMAVAHMTHKNERGASCNIVGGDIPPGAVEIGPLEAPKPALNPTNDPEGAKIVLEAKDVHINGATVQHNDLNAGNSLSTDQLGAMGAPGVELPESPIVPPIGETQAGLPAGFIDPDADELDDDGGLPDGNYFEDDASVTSDESDEEIEDEEPNAPTPVTRRKSGARK